MSIKKNIQYKFNIKLLNSILVKEVINMILEQKVNTIRTRTRYKIIGSDYSAQEP